MLSNRRNWLAAGLLIMAAPVIWLYSAANAVDGTYKYGIRSGGIGGDGWLVWVEHFVVNEQFGVPVGNLGGGDPEGPPYGAGAGLSGPVPVPKKVRARWFSFRNQTFYEAKTEIDRESRKRIAQWLRKYSDIGYNHHLTIGYAGQGYWSAWWVVYCSYGPCEDNRPRKKVFPLFTKVAAHEVPGDPRKYVVNSEAMIRNGEMPPVELPVRPQPGTGSEDLDDYRTIALGPFFSNAEYRYRFVFPDGTSLEGQTESGKPIQWPNVAKPPEHIELTRLDGSKVVNQSLAVKYHGYGFKERRDTDENGFVEIDQRFVKPPSHIDFE